MPETDKFGNPRITLQKYIDGLKRGLIEPVHEVLVNGEQRLYGKTVEGQGDNPQGWILVYAVVPT